MKTNISFATFKKNKKKKKNQIIFQSIECKNKNIIENIINNFLNKKNTFGIKFDRQIGSDRKAC